MKSPLLYLLEVLFCSGMLLAFYRLLLLRKVSFAACRRYLVVGVFLSMVIPALDIPLYPARTVAYPVPLIKAVPTVQVIEDIPFEALDAADTPTPIPAAEAALPEAGSSTNWGHIARITVMGLYLLTVALLLGMLAARIISIRRLRRRARVTDCGEYALAEHPKIQTPFSFLRTVFLGDGYQGARREIVLCHEFSHIRHSHSLERITLELVRCLFWFNPFVWIAGRWLAEVQEWEADRDVLDAGYDLTEYRTIVFHQLFGYDPDIACGLNRSLTKNRFVMMTQSKERRYTLLRVSAAIPVVVGMMLLCSFTTKSPEPVESGTTSRIHISNNGTITLNGQPITKDELVDRVAAERDKLSEADRERMQVMLTSEKPGNLASFPFESVARLDILQADKISYSLDGRTTTFAGNVHAIVRYHEELGIDEPETELWCNSMTVHENGEFECFKVRIQKGQAFKLLPIAKHTLLPTGEWEFSSKNKSGSVEDEEVIIEVAADSKIHFNGYPVTIEQLRSVVSTWKDHRRDTEPILQIFVDEATPGNLTTNVMASLRGIGIIHLRILREPLREPGMNSFSFGTMGRVEVTAADRIAYDLGSQLTTFAGNVRACFYDNSRKPVWETTETQFRSDSLIVSPDRYFQFLGNVLLENNLRMGMGDHVRFEVSPYGAWDREMIDYTEVGNDRAIIQIAADGKIRVNSELVPADRLSDWFTTWRGQRSSADPSARITADQTVDMTLISDVKEALRSAGIMRISYRSDNNSRPVNRVLPPRQNSTGDNANAALMNTPAVSNRNLYQIHINRNGQILAGHSGIMRAISPEQLPYGIQTFLLNADGDPAMSESLNTKIQLPGDGVTYYPVSRGILSLIVDRGVTYQRYVDVQNLLEQTYTELRDKASRDLFDKSYSDLSESEIKTVREAVPMNLTEVHLHRVPGK